VECIDSSKVSIVVPLYDSGTHIAETMATILAQTYQNYEIIIVDDGSVDDSLTILKSENDRIFLISKSNGGPASARNIAIKVSSGPFIAFLDSDDLWVANKLEEQVACLQQSKSIGLVYSEALMFSQFNAVKSIKCKIGYTQSPAMCNLLFGDFIPNSSVIIRRSCIEKIGLLDEDKALIAVEDYDYWLRIAKHYAISAISKPLAYYRIQSDNLVGDGKNIDKGLRLAFVVLNKIENLYPEIWKECGIERDMLFARLHIRAGVAWKMQKKWGKCILKFIEALNHSPKLRIFRWIVAATILKRWS